MVVRLPGREQENLVLVLVGGPEPVDARDGCHDDHIPAREQAGGRGVPQPVDLVVDGRVLLDVGVGGGEVRLWLVIVVIRDEVLDPVVREEAPQLAASWAASDLFGASTRVVRCTFSMVQAIVALLPLPVIPSSV